VHRLQAWDAAWSARLALTQTDARWPAAAKMAHLGDGSLVFGGLALVVLAGWLFRRPELVLMMGILLATLLATATIIVIIKYSLRRERPRDPTGFVTLSYDKYSFPSGHSARMSCLAVTLLFFNLPLGIGLSLLALLVAGARVLVGVHYLSDVLAGLLIGAATAAGVIKLINILF